LDVLLQARIDLGLLRQRLLHEAGPRLLDALPFFLLIGLQLSELEPLLLLLLLLLLLNDLDSDLFLPQFLLSLSIVHNLILPTF